MSPFVQQAALLFSAAYLALSVAIGLGLEHPFWAAMPVWVVSQSFREDLLSRAGFRVLGTLLGAGLGVAILGLGGVALPAVALGVVVGLSAAAAFALAPFGYGAMLTGITASVIVVPCLVFGVPAGELALDRVWCTLVGVASVTLVTLPLTPTRGAPTPRPASPHRKRELTFRAALAAVLTGAGTYAAATLGGYVALSGAMSLTIFSTILASLRDPTPVLKYLPGGAGIGVLAAVAYRAILSMTSGGMGPHLIVGGSFLAAGALLRAHPRTKPLGLDANMCFLISAEVGAEGHAAVDVLLGGALLVSLAFVQVRAWPWGRRSRRGRTAGAV